jgi:hypothetical protein
VRIVRASGGRRRLRFDPVAGSDDRCHRRQARTPFGLARLRAIGVMARPMLASILVRRPIADRPVWWALCVDPTDAGEIEGRVNRRRGHGLPSRVITSSAIADHGSEQTLRPTQSVLAPSFWRQGPDANGERGSVTEEVWPGSWEEAPGAGTLHVAAG